MKFTMKGMKIVKENRWLSLLFPLLLNPFGVLSRRLRSGLLLFDPFGFVQGFIWALALGAFVVWDW
jgi:hypothetical protein